MVTYGLRYCFLYRSKMRGRYLYEVEIEEKEYQGEVEVLKPCGDVLSIQQGVQDDSPFVSIKGSEATIEILCTDDMRYLSLFTVDARRFRVSIYESRPDTSGREVPALMWRGFLDANSYSEKFARPPYKVTLKALDGLAALDGYPFLDESGKRYTGLKSARSLLELCLDQLGLELPVVEWIGVRKLAGYDETLPHVYYDCSDIYRGNQEATWGDVLKLCLPYGAQIFQAYGCLHVRRVASLIYDARPEAYADSHADIGLRRRAIIPLWQSGCEISADADLKILPPLREIELSVAGSTAQNLASSMGFYEFGQWRIPYGEGRFFDDCLQLQIADNDASATYNVTRCSLARTVEATRSGGVSVKFDVLNLQARERKVAAALFLEWFDTSAHAYRTDAWYVGAKEWREVDETASDMSMYVEQTIMASDRDHGSISHRADPSNFSSGSLSIAASGIPHDGQLWIGIKAGTIHDIGDYDWAIVQVYNAEISISGNFEAMIPTQVVDSINRAYSETLKVELPVRDGAYVPNAGLYLEQVVREVSGVPSLHSRSPYGGTDCLSMTLADARALRARVAYELNGELCCSDPVDMNTLFVDRKYTGRLYYVNYLERNVTRDVYKAQLYELMDASRHPQWNGEYKSMIDRNEFAVQALFNVGQSVFFSERYRLWRIDDRGVPQMVCSATSPLYVHQGRGCLVVGSTDPEPWIASYDASGTRTVVIGQSVERLGVAPSDSVTRDALTGIWMASHIDAGQVTVVLFKDDGRIVDTRTLSCDGVQRVLFTQNAVVLVTSEKSYIHNFSVHSEGELGTVESWTGVCQVEAISPSAVLFRSQFGTHINSRVGMGLWLSEGVRVPFSEVTALSDRFAALCDGQSIRIYDFYNDVLLEIPIPNGRTVMQMIVVDFNMLYVLADDEVMQYYLLDDTVLGNEDLYIYRLEPVVSAEQISAAGGSATITALFNVLDESGRQVSSEQVTPGVAGRADGFEIDGNVVIAQSRGTEVADDRTVLLTLTHRFIRNGMPITITAQTTIRQLANRIERMEVADVDIVSGSTSFGAAGGTMQMAFPLSGVFTSGAKKKLDVYPNMVTGSALQTWAQVRSVSLPGLGMGVEVTVPNLGTVETPERSTTVNMQLTCRYHGMSYVIPYAFSVMQSANRMEGYGVPTIEPSTIVVTDIPASGGSVTGSSLRFTGAQSMEYSSGASEIVVFTQSTAGVSVDMAMAPIASSLGTTVKSRTKVGDVSFTVSLNGMISTVVTAAVYQAANQVKSYNLPVISSFTVSDIPASGGSATRGVVTWSQSAVYSSGATGQVSTSSGTVSYSTAVKAPSLGTTVKARTKVGTLTVTVNSHSKSSSKNCDVYQAANRLEGYGVPTIESTTVVVSDLPASGGTVSASDLRFAGAQSMEYSSGDSEVVAFTQSSSGVSVKVTESPTASSLDTTVKSRTKVGDVSFTVSLNGKISTAVTAAVYQAANQVVSMAYKSVYGSSGIVSGLSPQNYPAQGGRVDFYMRPTLTYSSGASKLVNPTGSNVRSAASWVYVTSMDNATFGRIFRCQFSANQTGNKRQTLLTIQLYYDLEGNSLSTLTSFSVSQL